MMLDRWRFAVLSALALLLATAGMVSASEEAPISDQPQATAQDPAEATADSALPSEPAAEPATEPEVAAVDEEGAQTTGSQVRLPAVPPPTLQDLIDQRRDELRERREALFDAMTGRFAYMSPGLAAHDRAMEDREDAMRQLHRLQRDSARQYQDSMLDTLHPWSRPQRERSRMRSYLMQMEQLDRREARDAWLATRPYAMAGPMPW